MSTELKIQLLDALVASGALREYSFQLTRNDTGDPKHTYDQLTMIFPDGTRVAVIPEQRYDRGGYGDSEYGGLGIYTTSPNKKSA